MSKIIGVTGAFGSGKSTAALFFEKKGFKKYILSQFLEKEARKRGIENITRKILQDIGNELREKFGSAILAEYVLDEIKKNGIEKTVIDGIRNAAEIEALKKSAEFNLIAIISTKEKRFERLKKLKRRENLTWEIFESLDSRDANDGNIKGLQVNKCIEMADVKIENNGTEEEFENKLKNYAG